MTFSHRLDRIRPRSQQMPRIKGQLLVLLVLIAAGLLAGYLAKLFDLLPYQRAWSETLDRFWEGLGRIGSMFSVWTLICTLLAVYSPSPLWSGVRCLSFFFPMSISYYLYQAGYYGVFNRHAFLFWSAAALLSAGFGAVIWYAKGNGWPAAALTAALIAVFLSDILLAFPSDFLDRWQRGLFLSSLSDLMVVVFSAVAAVLVYLLLQRTLRQRLIVLPFALLFTPLVFLTIVLFYPQF